GEGRVVRRGPPARAPGRVALRVGGLLAVEDAGLDAPPGPGDVEVARAAEEGRQLPELLAGPVAAGAVVVALGALQLDAQEQAGGGGGQVLRLALVGLVEGAGLGGAGQDAADDLVEGDVGAQLLPPPGLEGVGLAGGA